MAKKRSRIIAVDLDGVLAHTETEIQRRVQAHFGLEPEDEICKDKYLIEERYNIPAKEMEDFLQSEHVFESSDFWLLADPIKENLNAINKAVAYGHRIYIVTGRHGSCRESTEQWLDQQGVVCHGLLMDTIDVKHEAMKFLGAEMMFEDRFHEAKIIAQKGFKSYLIKRDYNYAQFTEQSDPLPMLKLVTNINVAFTFERVYQ
jgi:uncharacterized HAD superfamily protein